MDVGAYSDVLHDLFENLVLDNNWQDRACI